MSHIKKFQGLGMNINSDQYLLPDGYTAIEQPYYPGDGNLSVAALEALCKEYQDYCHQQTLIKDALIKEIKSL